MCSVSVKFNLGGIKLNLTIVKFNLADVKFNLASRLLSSGHSSVG